MRCRCWCAAAVAAGGFHEKRAGSVEGGAKLAAEDMAHETASGQEKPAFFFLALAFGRGGWCWRKNGLSGGAE